MTAAAHLARGRSFRHEGYDVAPEASRLTCRYSLDGERYTETFTFPGGGNWDTAAADAAARLLFLLAGVSNYKTTAPPSIDLGDHPLTADERSLLLATTSRGSANSPTRTASTSPACRSSRPTRTRPRPEPPRPAPATTGP